jgi:hypothetical protein
MGDFRSVARIAVPLTAALAVAGAVTAARLQPLQPPALLPITPLVPSAAQAVLMAAEGEAAAATPREPAPPPTATVLGTWEAQGILGRSVRSAANENMGRIVDVIVDRSGQARAAVIDFGGFLGVGSRKVAVDWSALRVVPAGKDEPIALDLTRDQIKAAPEYKPGKPMIVLDASGAFGPLHPQTPEK